MGVTGVENLNNSCRSAKSTRNGSVWCVVVSVVLQARVFLAGAPEGAVPGLPHLGVAGVSLGDHSRSTCFQRVDIFMKCVMYCGAI